MKIRNGKTPITNLPLIKAGDPITARWANSVTRAIEELKRRTPVLTGVMPRSIAQTKRLPFELYTRGSTLVAHPGVIGMESIPEEIMEEPADGVWYFQARVVIDPDTGLMTEAAGEWTQTPTTNTGTERALVIGLITVTDGMPDLTTLSQSTFGPVLVVVYGGVDEIWNVLIY